MLFLLFESIYLDFTTLAWIIGAGYRFHLA
jgi:hypothetical protein